MDIDIIAKLLVAILFILATEKGELTLSLSLILKRSSCHGNNLRALGDIACYHGKAIGGVIVQILRREEKARKLRHRLGVRVFCRVWITAVLDASVSEAEL